MVLILSVSIEDALGTAVSLGGDNDKMACIAGAVAEAFYGGVPAHIAVQALKLPDPPLWKVVEEFRCRLSAIN